MSYKHYLDDVLSYVRSHHEYRARTLNLIASENIASPTVRKILSSDLGHRYAVGFLYSRMYHGTRYIDRIEELVGYLARKLFRCEHVNHIPVSGTLANLIMMDACLQPGDVLAAVSVLDGGHSSFKECSRVRGVSMVPLPFDEETYNIDVDASIKLIHRISPKLVLLGASEFLFPHPVAELRDAVSEVNGILAYDSAHVLGLIAGGKFQDPLREGAEIVTGSTHKTFFGPQGGIILCKRQFSEAIDNSALKLVNNHHINRVAALAAALCEMLEFGEKYAEQTVRNAKALAESLYERGINVLCPDLGFTESHQVLFDVGKGKAKNITGILEDANIITNPTPLPHDNSDMDMSGVRLGVQEITRLGMKESEMVFIAELISKVLGGVSSSKIKTEVADLLSKFQSIHYSFDDGLPAYDVFL
ncbi:MAG TPA: aminotransferase class I/II-fold pyridoxal phosphate-dependent enzyme [Candidatus Bathyarchaeota archaeon]|nr:aminotransferase class I/II-fold pyridoxal phosphate-dependent enzyme [Candidatus Bathyarchaeota archaeon]